MVKIGICAIEKDLSDYTVFESSFGLFKMGVKVIEQRFGYYGNPIGLLIDTSSIPEEGNLRDKTHVVNNLIEIANHAYGKKEYLFNWNNVPLTDTSISWSDIPERDAIQKFLEINMNVGWIKNAKIKKTDRIMTISDERNLNSISFNLDEKKLEYGVETHIFNVKKENNGLKIYIYKFEQTLKGSLTFLWVLGAFLKKDYPNNVTDLAMQLKKSKNQVIIDLFGYNVFREEARKYIKTNCPQLESELQAFEELYDDSVS